MKIEITLKDGSKFAYVDVYLIEYNEIDNAVYLERRVEGGYEANAFINVAKVVML